MSFIQGVTGMDGQPGPKGNVVSLGVPCPGLVAVTPGLTPSCSGQGRGIRATETRWGCGGEGADSEPRPREVQASSRRARCEIPESVLCSIQSPTASAQVWREASFSLCVASWWWPGAVTAPTERERGLMRLF